MSIGVMGDVPTYGYAVRLRAVTSVDGLTADLYPFGMRIANAATRIVNEVKGANRVVYDESSGLYCVSSNDTHDERD